MLLYASVQIQRGEMRTITDSFLGAVLSAWLGIETRIWEKPFLTIFFFVLALGVQSVLLNVSIASNLKSELRIFLVVILLTLFSTSGLAFAKLEIIAGDQQIIFYYSILLGWLVIGLGAALVESNSQLFISSATPTDTNN